MKKLKEYALYKGDKLIAMGTVHEIAKETGLKENTIYFYGMPVYKRRMKKYNSNCKCLVLLEEDDEEEE